MFHVTMDVSIPIDFDNERADELKRVEKARCHELMEAGTWRHVWRVAGKYKNVSIFDVPSNDALHDLLMGLPLFPFMTIEVTALCRHPSSIRDDDR